jgi:hypothetical protein
MDDYELLPMEPAQPPSTFQKGKDFLQNSARNINRQGVNLAAQAIGLPGDVLSLLNNFIASPLSKAVTGEGKPYEETMIGKLIPTSEKHKEALQSISPDYLKPRNQVEQLADDIIADTAALALPVGRAARTAQGIKKASMATKIPRAFGISLGANLVGEGVKDFTADQGKASLAKIGTLFALSLINKNSAAKHVGELYKKAESAIPEGAQIEASGLTNTLNRLKKEVSMGTKAPSEKFIIDEVDAVLSKIKKGKITPREAWAAKRSLNEKLEKVLYETPKKEAQARARKLSSRIQDSLDQTLQSYGKKNPEFYESFKQAQEGFSTLAKSNVISRFVENNLKYSPLTAGLLHLFQGPIGASAATAAIPYEGLKLLYRVKESPILAKYYGNALKAAAKEDAIAFNRELKKLDSALQKAEKNDSFELLD